MRGIKKGAYLLYNTGDDSYIIHLEEMVKGHYKTVYDEIPKKKRRRKKNYENFFTWTTVTKFKSEAKRLNLKVITETEVKKLLKEGI